MINLLKQVQSVGIGGERDRKVLFDPKYYTMASAIINLRKKRQQAFFQVEMEKTEQKPGGHQDSE